MIFNYYTPTRLVFGNDALDTLSSMNLPGKKALIVTGGTSVKKFGYLNRLLAQLKISNVAYVIFDKILPNPIADHIEEGAILARNEKCDFVIGIGGGSSMDSAKSIAMLATNDGKYWDYISGGTGKAMPVKKAPLPIIVITTTAGTGSEVDPWTVISNGEEKIGFGQDFTFPCIGIVDPSLTLTVPPHLTAYQGFDALCHSIEGYINKNANMLSDLYAEKAIALIGENLAKAVEDGANISAREKMSFANTLSGLVESGPGCTSCHSLEHALSAVAPRLEHGAGLISVMIEYYRLFIEADVCEDRFISLAKALGMKKADKGTDFLTAIEKLMKDCKVDSLKLSDYGIKKEEIKKIAEIAFDTMGDLFSQDRIILSLKDVIKIYEKSYK